MSTLLEDIQSTINHHSAENSSSTPDFILAKYLLDCLVAFELATSARENWYGRDAPTETTVS